MSESPRIIEVVEVIGEDGEMVGSFRREMDPSMYWISPDLRDAEWIERHRKVTEAQAKMLLADEPDGRIIDLAPDQP